MAPRIVWCCQPVAAAICSTVAPSGRLSSSIMLGLLGAGAGRGLVGRRSLGRLGAFALAGFALALALRLALRCAVAACAGSAGACGS